MAYEAMNNAGALKSKLIVEYNTLAKSQKLIISTSDLYN